MLANIIAWIQANPVLFAAVLWPAFTALVSLVYQKADSIPMVHAVLTMMVKAGFDLPGVLAALRRLLTGGGGDGGKPNFPSAPAGGVTPNGEAPHVMKAAVPTPPPDPAPWFALAFAALFAVSLAILCAGCSLFGQGSKVPSDLIGVEDCVAGQLESGVSSFAVIASACAPGEIATVVDIVEVLLSRPNAASRYPNAATLKAQVHVERGYVLGSGQTSSVPASCPVPGAQGAK